MTPVLQTVLFHFLKSFSPLLRPHLITVIYRKCSPTLSQSLNAVTITFAHP